ncbi:hypothetical protein BO71DRAFT_436470 [Aspergillus ellipticus CBS 707.79]|uniref:Deoxyribonuclease NucA/NucB domain-containing protein n=1 Tax=Aspergillus ellipticus CBS 707.79 TaxID=1448320 RepID=A0A319D9G0_9EURO|nr:hypothetical protein BO71DRAFT_436470 [Aspergillus ellipticus CBS 707.79]
MQQFLFLVGILSLLSLGSAATVAFNCDSANVGDVCLNISFTWDRPSRSVADRRSRTAGCGSSNRCSRAPYGSGYQCDEYPFKSVQEADRGNQINRCVGQTLRNFYYSRGEFRNTGCHSNAPCQFNVGFTHASGLGYCQSQPNCTNDGNEYTRSGPARRDEEPEGGFYRLASGTILFVPSEVEIGEEVYRVSFRDATLLDSNGLDDYDLEYDEGDDASVDNIKVEEDVVVEKVAGWMDETLVIQLDIPGS